MSIDQSRSSSSRRPCIEKSFRIILASEVYIYVSIPPSPDIIPINFDFSFAFDPFLSPDNISPVQRDKWNSFLGEISISYFLGTGQRNLAAVYILNQGYTDCQSHAQDFNVRGTLTFNRFEMPFSIDQMHIGNNFGVWLDNICIISRLKMSHDGFLKKWQTYVDKFLVKYTWEWIMFIFVIWSWVEMDEEVCCVFNKVLHGPSLTERPIINCAMVDERIQPFNGIWNY